MGKRTTGFRQERAYSMPPTPSKSAPECVTRLEWLTHGIDGYLRSDLQNKDLAQMANYLVGGEPNQSGHVRTPEMRTRASHTADFSQRWMAKQALPDGDVGYDPSKANWRIGQAWCYQLVTGDLWNGKIGFEPHHYRMILSPDPKAWPVYGLADRSAQSEFVDEMTSRFVTQMEKDIYQRLHAVWSVHSNTDATHSHTCLRGLTVEGDKVFVPPEYRRTGMRMLARNIMYDMIKERGLRRAG